LSSPTSTLKNGGGSLENLTHRLLATDRDTVITKRLINLLNASTDVALVIVVRHYASTRSAPHSGQGDTFTVFASARSSPISISALHLQEGHLYSIVAIYFSILSAGRV